MPKEIILFPFSGNAREALVSIMSLNSRKMTWKVVGFLDDDPKIRGRSCLGVKVLGSSDMVEKFSGAQVLAVPGNPGDFIERAAIIEKLGLGKGRFATIIDPSAVLSPDAKVGYNTLIMANVFVSCGAAIGNHCIVLPNSVISHDSSIGDYCCVGSNVSISGNVKIGKNCYIGSGVSVRERALIRDGSLIGLGANVVSDIESGVVAVGNPARAIRKAKK